MKITSTRKACTMRTTYYKDSPVLDFEDHERWSTKLGAGKLTAVVENIDGVLKFLSENGRAEVVQRFNERFLNPVTEAPQGEVVKTDG